MLTKLAKRPRSRKIDERFRLPANDVRIKAVILSWGRSECCALDPLIDKTAPVNCVKQGKSMRFGAFGSRRWRKSVAFVPLRAAKIHFRKFCEQSRNIFAINEKFSHFATMRRDSGSPDTCRSLSPILVSQNVRTCLKPYRTHRTLSAKERRPLSP